MTPVKALRSSFALSLRPFAVLLVLGLMLAVPSVIAKSALEASELPYSDGVLWQVARDGQSPSYVFGTIHVADERVLDLPAPVLEAFADSQSATFEIILDQEAQVAMAQASLLTDGRTLDQIIGPDLYDKAVEAAADYGLPGQALRYFKAWALFQIFAVPPEQFMLIAAGKPPLDQWLQSEASKEGKKVYALETIQEQISLFEGMSEAEQKTMLKPLLVDKELARNQFRDLITAYLAGDLAAIQDQVDEQSDGPDKALAEAFFDELIVERNKRMVERMADILNEGRSFVAVGALHLPGDHGVLNLLAEQGYQVTRVH